MDVFNALWDDPEQRKRPPDDNFQLFTMEEWFAMSSTHKILTGSLQCPLPHEIEPSKGAPKSALNRNIRDLLMQKSKRDAASMKAAQLKDSNDGKLYVPGFSRFPHFARISDLTSQEHAECLRLWMKFDGKPTEELTVTEKAEHQLFQSLYSRVKAEQKEFLECAKINWPEVKHRTVNIKGDPHNYFLQFWANKVSNAMSQYPHKYVKLKTFSIHENAEMGQKLHFVKNLLNIGKIAMARLPDFHEAFRVASSILKLRTWAFLNVPPSNLNGTLHKVPVSRDPNAERLARLHGANVVISTSGMRCLLDNYDEKKCPVSEVGRSWVLPIIVKEHRSFCDGKPVTKTIIFIDKQLPKPKMTGVEKVSWYQKHALFAAVVTRNRNAGIEFDIKGEDILIRRNLDSTDTMSESSSGTNAEESALKHSNKSSSIEQPPSNNDSSNLCNPPPSTLHPNRNKNNVPDDEDDDDNDDDDDDDDDDALMIDLPDNEVSSSKQVTPSRKAVKSDDSEIKAQPLKSKETICTEDSVTKSPPAELACCGGSNKQTQPGKWEKICPPEPVQIVNGNALPVSNTNLTYNLWCLKSEEEENDQNQSGEINLLIRSRVDGCEPLDHGKYQPICLASKPEYQLEYGPSIIPLSDLTRQWTKLLIQPNTELARVRVNVQRAELVTLEKRSILEIEEEAQTLYKTALSDNLKCFQQILRELIQLPTGQYLLSHSPQMGSSVELFKASNEANVIDWYLPKDYGSRPEIIDYDMPWPEIDTNVILPRHLQIQSMPCTFHSPKGPTLKSKPSKPQNQQPQQGSSSRYKKKNRKKNKKAKPTNKAEEPEEEASTMP
ncbi:little elongation complex subunit 2-like isoform X2 [Thrips palmi]|uniref:Little elongation complex subunit 2-like isoform X2 n=1 Tax=Thrips palmi TaxID=161013 RepID=A0A6P8ZW07_THRPL|nr:little elongation complex subunit 2-like isoform X2 [Thrips palmi]